MLLKAHHESTASALFARLMGFAPGRCGMLTAKAALALSCCALALSVLQLAVRESPLSAFPGGGRRYKLTVVLKAPPGFKVSNFGPEKG